MRILLLALQLPAPADNGLRQRTAAMLMALREAGHEIVLLAAAGARELSGQERQRMGRWCRVWEVGEVSAARLSGGGAWGQRWAAWRSGQAYAVRRFQSPPLRAQVRAWLEREKFDAVWCETPYMTEALPERHPPLIINTHNLEHRIVERYLAIEGRRWHRAYAAMEMQRLRAWERSALLRAQLILACSELECRQIRGWLGVACPRVAYAPNIVYPWPAPPVSQAGAGLAQRLVFVGGLNWLPNRDAVAWFARQVWPQVRSELPEAEWWVAGHPGPARWQRRWRATPGLQFLGRVEDARACLAQAALVLAPLRVGGGTRLKILEAASLGRPVVATSMGAEGLHFTPGQEIEIADEAPEMADIILALLRSPSAASRLGQAARRRAEAEYSPVSLAHRLAGELGAWPRKESHGVVLSTGRGHAA